ncbi:hypothetical protein DCE79_11825 [Lysinibacillus sp. 2017]|nr:hypothetical protein DCE79_02660 [Lysinibacillus sp. 2017]AWE06529.1 hypothetical protein DCE79_03635 [Lysinibacillus sp. 2017]AWE07882.1 hypothetical protein DCE79_11005 [Lysinibacillus sp. 2017]AWE07883.1 hypothetical protein DCE79_11015 [Lysinibacillus sp. 2017]AWE08031.1 hypothetical protein DCE79_11825 [Lysinibacillus sp. 2017]
MGVRICEPLAENKGVRGDAESEGSSRQNLGLRNTNRMRLSHLDKVAKQTEVQNILGKMRR